LADAVPFGKTLLSWLGIKKPSGPQPVDEEKAIGSAQEQLKKGGREDIAEKLEGVTTIKEAKKIITDEGYSESLASQLLGVPQASAVPKAVPAPAANKGNQLNNEALEKANRDAKKSMEREHTTPYFWENPHLFTIGNISWERNIDYSMSHRFTLDYIEDFNFISRIYEELYEINRNFSLEDILILLDAKPEIYALNSIYAGVNWYRNHLEELSTIAAHQTKKI
jgi:hypothetical protein